MSVGSSTTVQMPDAWECGGKEGREGSMCCRQLKEKDERSLVDPAIVRDIIIGLADGLTVPFALTAGLSSLGSSRIVVLAGVAELVSGAFSMGVGGYLSAEAERDNYRYMRRTTRNRVMRSCAGQLERETSEILAPFGVDASTSRRVTGALLSVEASLPETVEPPSVLRQALTFVGRHPKFSLLPSSDVESSEMSSASSWNGSEKGDGAGQPDLEMGLTAFLLKFGEGLEEVSDARLFISAFTIGMSYFFGGLVPLLPYFFIDSARTALSYSIGVTTIALILFGACKTRYSGAQGGVRGYTYGCLSTLLVGGAAAGASWAIVRLLEASGLQ
ncbi:hypothetical protein MNV49_005118 [Pseudohyphozyma bogoriensis]|nr:hypothetical protein MNV49_005118 [Pseudohyphozyma bogoriensis]